MRRCCWAVRTGAAGGACGVAGPVAVSPCCCRSASQTMILRADRCVALLPCRAAPKAVGSRLAVREERRARIVRDAGRVWTATPSIAF